MAFEVLPQLSLFGSMRLLEGLSHLIDPFGTLQHLKIDTYINSHPFGFSSQGRAWLTSSLSYPDTPSQSA
jgi:hypothetical protein